ncbi:carbohydrate ABC transporter substrate-binding protein [Candidatus Phytoplasma rubi]|uniref:Carbohydrate ABC transporter substrate-binding protein n=1 Tax=Candidatus Phytoplasma rubi TaxID=399025 RepID=A0ABY7BQL9_9MOLU|nr:extracellular solute-binding protein [Candidatus Phytoplasma rubi]WAN63075.1 carbohydrate ABC transporter substrate-binding protein [Candidatus Phytoplasma rubi]
MVSRDKIKNFLFLFGYFLLLFLIACIFNIIAISNKNNFKEKPFILKEGRLKEAPEDFKNRKEKVKITFWHNLYDKEAAVLKKIIKDFEKDYPGIEVLADNKGSWGQIFKHVSNALTVDKQPNLVVSYPDHVGFYHKSNKVLPLNIFIEKDEKFQKEQNNFLKFYFEKIKIEDKEENYYLPFLKTTEIMFYNKDLLKKAKESCQNKELDQLINDKGEITKDSLTWDEMYQVSKKLKDLNKKDFIPIVIDSESNLFIISTKQKGINYPITKKDTKKFLKEPKVKKLLKNFKEKYDEKYFTLGKLTGEIDKIPELFMNNNIAFYITSTRRLETLCIKNDFIPKLGYTNIPTFDSSNLNQNILQGSNVNLFYSQNEDEMLASWFFLKYLTSEDVYKEFLKENKFFNITRQVPKKKEKINEIYKNLEKTKSNEETELQKLRKDFFENFILKNAKRNNFFTTSIFENSDFFRNIIEDLFIDILTIDAKDVNKEKKIEELLNEAIQRTLTN